MGARFVALAFVDFAVSVSVAAALNARGLTANVGCIVPDGAQVGIIVGITVAVSTIVTVGYIVVVSICVIVGIIVAVCVTVTVGTKVAVG